MKPTSKSWLRILVGAALAVCGSVALSQSKEVEVLPPDRLVACSPTSAFAHLAQQSLSKMGELIGCFVSDEQVRLQGSGKEVSEPLEYAFVVALTPSPKPYSLSDVQSMFEKVGEQWKDTRALDQQARNEYEKQLLAIAASSQARMLPAAAAQLAPPTLVSIERIGTGSYIVMTIRQRKVVQGDQAIVTSAIDATAITLRGGSLLRLSIARALVAPTDVDLVRRAMGAWIASIGGRTGSR